MPLLPIDLQIMFSQMSQVGREQAVQQDVTPQYQFVQGSEIAQQAEHEANAVNQPRQVGDGPEAVKEQEQREKRRQARRRGAAGREKGKEEGEAEIFDDPDLGHHVNLVG